MKKYFADRPMLGFFVVAVAATIVSTWILNPQSGPLALFSAGMSWTTVLRIIALLMIFVVGAGLTYVAMRLAGDPTAFGLAPGGQSYTPGRRLNVTSLVSAARTADQVLV